MQDVTPFLTNHLPLAAGCAVVFVLLVIIELMRAKRGNVNITPAQMTQLINRQNAVVIDVRPNDIYRKSHIIDANSLSIKEIQDSPKKLEKYKSKPIIIVCNTGVESQKIAALLLKQGYNAFSLAGGIRAWMAADMPLVKE